MILTPRFMKQLLHQVLGGRRYQALQYFIYKKFVPNMGYTQAYYQNIENANRHCYALFARMVVAEYHPQVIIDVGCGSGGITRAFLEAG